MKIEDLKRLLEAATPGPWRYVQCPDGAGNREFVLVDQDSWNILNRDPKDMMENANLIVALRNHAEVLIEIVEAAKAAQPHLEVDIFNPESVKANHDLAAALKKLEELK